MQSQYIHALRHEPSGANRPIRLRLSGEDGPLAACLLVKHVKGRTSICGGFDSRRFEIEISDGSTLKGVSDAAGKTGLLEREAMHIARIRILTDEQ